MSNRTVRRALERQAINLGRKIQAAATATAAFEIPKPATPRLDECRQATNRSNAQHSTGPVTPAGKAVSARNALKHGLTGNTVLLDAEDSGEYQSRLDYYTSLYKPVTFEEQRLVQAIHDSNWRLDRICNLEYTIYAKGRLELKDSFEELPLVERKSFIQLETSQRYAKDLRNLHIQEARLQRQRVKDLAGLKQLQSERKEAEEAEAADQVAQKSAPPPTGFVFESAEIGVPSAEYLSCQSARIEQPNSATMNIPSIISTD